MGRFRRVRVLEPDPATLAHKQRVALRSGFLGIDSLGWSTLAIVTEATEAERQAWSRASPRNCWRSSARRIWKPRAVAAEEEVAFAASLCDHPAQTLLAVQRSIEDGEIRERFRTLKPREATAGADRLHAHARAFTFHEVEGEDEPDRGGRSAGIDGTGPCTAGSQMREFWVASGHHLTRRADHGGLIATPELIMAYLARPELMPPDDACAPSATCTPACWPIRFVRSRKRYRSTRRSRCARELDFHDEFSRPADRGSLA